MTHKRTNAPITISRSCARNNYYVNIIINHFIQTCDYTIRHDVHVFITILKARQLGILPKTSSLGSDGGGDLRSKLESKPRQLLVINSVTDKDLLVKYFEVSLVQWYLLLFHKLIVFSFFLFLSRSIKSVFRWFKSS